MLEKSRGSSPDVSQPVGMTRAGPELCLPTFEAAEMFLAGSAPQGVPKLHSSSRQRRKNVTRPCPVPHIFSPVNQFVYNG